MEEHRGEKEEQSAAHGTNHWLPVLVVILFVAAGLSLAYTFAQRSALLHLQAKDQNLTSTNQQLSDTVSQMDSTVSQLRGQVSALNSKLTAMSEPQRAAPRGRNGQARVVRRGPTAWQQVQAKLKAQQTQISQMQDEVAKQKSDIEGELGSTRDQLNGSIARNHTELVALESRGERNYYEFDLTKSKQFERLGPVLLSLRGTNVKHQHFNMNMLVNDRQLTKKNVNLYEPVWLYQADGAEPVQVVVNKIGKNYVHGYVSAPKYTKAELAAMQQQPEGQTNTQTPATSNGQNPPAKPSPTQQNPIPQQPHNF